MRSRVSIDGREHAVEAALAAPGRLRLSVDGVAEEVEVLPLADGAWLVTADGAPTRLTVARAPDGVWVHHRGRTRLVRRAAPPRREVEARSAGAGGPTTTAPPTVATPPMPAVVSAILVEPGQAVRRGDALVVVTAMKLETSLLAGVDGVVRRVATTVGARVRPGDVLVELEPGGAP